MFNPRINKKLSLLLVTVMAFSFAHAINKNAGKYGFQFMKIPASVELAGMANTGEITVSSPLTMFHNPVSYQRDIGSNVSFSHTNWLIDTNMYNAGWRKTNFNNSFGLGIKYVDHGEFENRTDNGTLIGHYYPMDLNIVGNYTLKLNPNFYTGLNLNLVYEKIHTSSVLAFSSDLGFLYLTPIRNTSFDLVFKNMLTHSGKMDLEKVNFPLISEFGFTTGFDLNDYLSVYPSIKLSYLQDSEDIHTSFGLNSKIYQTMSVRLGYKTNYNEENFSAGVGFSIGKTEFSYAFINNIDNVHLFGISLSY